MPASLARRVWIADDSALEADLVRRSLCARFAVEVFRDGPSLIERCADNPPSVLVLDWHMPGMSGVDVCRFLRSQPSTADAGILVLTALHATTSDLVEALNAGANDYLIKPFVPDELLARVEALFRVQEKRRRTAQAGSAVRVLLEQLPDPLVAVDTEGRLSFANLEAERLFGWTTDAPLGRPLAEVAPELASAELARGHQGRNVKIDDRVFMPAIRQVSLGDEPPVVTIALRDITERVRAEEQRAELQERARRAEARALERLNGFVKQAPVAMTVLRGPEHVVELANDHCLALIGRGPEIIGKPLRQALPALLDEALWQALEAVYTDGKPFTAGELAARIDGEERFFNSSCQPTHDEQGAVDGVVVVVVEVTEQVRARHRMEQLAIERKSVLTQIRECVIFSDANGRVAFVNEAAAALRGTGAVGQPVTESPPSLTLYSMDGRPFTPDELPLARAARGEKIVAGEWMLRRSDGSFLVVQGNASPVQSERGETIGAVLTFRDVTEQRTLERTLRVSEERYRSLVDATSQITWTNSADGRMVGLQTSWGLFTGQRFDEYQGYGWSDAVHPDDRALTMALWRQAVDSQTPFHCEHRVRRHDGVYRDFLIRAVPVCERDGTVREWIGVHTDITDRKRAEAERLELLERERRARAGAEAASRAKDEFLAMLGHELRNPLAPILTALQVMKLRGESGSEREQEIIERQLRHVVRLVDDLLDVSRVTQGKIELKKQPVELSQVMVKAIEMASPILEQRSHNLTVTVPSAGLVVDADQVRLAQVLANLLTNAAKYTESGGDIRLAARRDGDDVVISVRDNGIGISADILPRIFDVFVQSHRSIERSQGGLGLGLTIVRSLVELHGGQVSASSDGLGHGSEFVVRLPRSHAQVVPRPPSESTALPPSEPAAMRVLVVDDNVDAAELLSTALDAVGYQTKVAHDGPSALSIAKQFRPDVALLDIGLPVMDGYELARQLRGQAELASLKMVALTGYGQESDRVRARHAGFDEHLVKPVDLGHLKDVLAGLVDGQPVVPLR